MQRSADRIMNGSEVGDVVMESLEAEHALRRAREPANERGRDPDAATVKLLQQDLTFLGKEAPHPVDAGCGSLGEAFGGENLGCGQCPHFGSRTVPYRCRIGPDSVCLGGSAVFAGAGTRFESHLGHVFSLFRGLSASECAQTVHCWAPPVAFFVGGDWAGGSFSRLGQRCCFVLLHGRERPELHDLV
jgi:hypothetical protein